MYVYIMPRRKEINHDLREAAVAAHLSRKSYKAITKLFHHLSENVRRIVSKWETFKTVGNLHSKFSSRSDHPILRDIKKTDPKTHVTNRPL